MRFYSPLKGPIEIPQYILDDDLDVFKSFLSAQNWMTAMNLMRAAFIADARRCMEYILLRTCYQFSADFLACELPIELLDAYAVHVRDHPAANIGRQAMILERYGRAPELDVGIDICIMTIRKYHFWYFNNMVPERPFTYSRFLRLEASSANQLASRAINMANRYWAAQLLAIITLIDEKYVIYRDKRQPFIRFRSIVSRLHPDLQAVVCLRAAGTGTNVITGGELREAVRFTLNAIRPAT